MNAQEIVASAVGQRCWRAERGYGTFLTFELGERVSGARRDHGEWHLWVYAGRWTLWEAARLLASDDDDHAAIDAVVGAFDGKLLTSAAVDPVSLEASFGFEDGLRLHVEPNTDEELSDADWWLLFTPSKRVLVVGPGPAWTYERADEPPPGRKPGSAGG